MDEALNKLADLLLKANLQSLLALVVLSAMSPLLAEYVSQFSPAAHAENVQTWFMFLFYFVVVCIGISALGHAVEPWRSKPAGSPKK